ncbi:hypothetical protein [Acinetobacter guillouiae]|uniref:hypothetical protein n=1 Tax=Acinetobacter guillouiae TaxID=106649 RepID=UPI001CD4043C|nr:hypothetical protein [Acinetobacter guillouiae]
MSGFGSIFLVIGAFSSAVAALAHIICIFIGAPAYRFLGAGESMARSAELGKLKPTLITITISIILMLCSIYALSGAKVIGYLPFTKFILIAITCVYLARALSFPILKPLFPENTITFWLISSSICLFVGLVHLFGLILQWYSL